MPDIQPASERNFVRSAESHDFERMWRELPRAGLVPDREVFKPERAKAFLRNLILIRKTPDETAKLEIRLIGSAIHERIGHDVTGRDYVDFLGEERREIALQVVRKVFAQPCGFWQVAPVHYERGYSHYWEMTAFPLAANEKSPALVLAYVRPVDGLVEAESTGERALRVGAAEPFVYIDIGAGVPAFG